MKQYQWIIAAVMGILLCTALAVKCRADDQHYVQFSLGSTVVRGPAAVADILASVPASVEKGAAWQFGVTVIAPSTFNGQHVRNNFAPRVQFVDGFGHFDFGLGFGYIQNVDPYVGAHLNFNLKVAWRFERLPVTLTYQHFSDEGTTASNLGRDMVLLGWRFL